MSGPEARILESTIGVPPVSDLVMSSSLVTLERSRRRREDAVCVRISKALEGVAIHSDGATADEICKIGVSNAKDGDPAGLNTIFPNLSGLKEETSERNMSIRPDMKNKAILTKFPAKFTHREYNGRFVLGMMRRYNIQQISKNRIKCFQATHFPGVRFQCTP